ncbi:MAG: hypothetical protein NT159_07770 [Proteobacteria bacterium]|nr:hypothetical protein [Pseudomonadota bacterium]
MPFPNKASARGIWPVGASAATSVGDEDALAIAAQARAKLIGQVEELYRDIAGVDLVIRRIADVLRVSQPLVHGRYDVRWWKVQAGDRGRQPVLVRWMKATTGRVQPKRVERYKGVGKHQAFDMNRTETDIAVKMFLKYAAYRKALTRKLWQLKHYALRIDSLRFGISDDLEYIGSIHYKIGKRLIAAGHEIDLDTATKMGLIEAVEG